MMKNKPLSFSFSLLLQTIKSRAVISKNMTRGLLLILASLALIACQQHPPLEVRFAIDESIDLRQYQTFTVLPVHHSDSHLVKYINPGIEKDLISKGYQLSDQPELVIEYRVDVDGSEKLQLDPTPIDGSLYVQNTVDSSYVVKILVNAIDKKTGNVVWKAATSRDLSNIGADNIDPTRFNVHMSELFESFPHR